MRMLGPTPDCNPIGQFKFLVLCTLHNFLDARFASLSRCLFLSAGTNLARILHVMNNVMPNEKVPTRERKAGGALPLPVFPFHESWKRERQQSFTR
jgi:hypothetical protein